MKLCNKTLKYILLFFIGGFLYVSIEVLTRGYSHISMLVAGGLSFIFIGLINEILPENTSLITQMLISSIIVTVIELATGLIVNVWLGLNVWDYSKQAYNFMGQICLLFSNLWFLLSLPAILLDDFLRNKLLGEKKHHYKVL